MNNQRRDQISEIRSNVTTPQPTVLSDTRVTSIPTILFDLNGAPVVGTSTSYYSATTERSSRTLGISITAEQHLVNHDGRWIVVSRTGSANSPVYIQDRTVPDALTGRAHIDQTILISA